MLAQLIASCASLPTRSGCNTPPTSCAKTTRSLKSAACSWPPKARPHTRPLYSHTRPLYSNSGVRCLSRPRTHSGALSRARTSVKLSRNHSRMPTADPTGKSPEIGSPTDRPASGSAADPNSPRRPPPGSGRRRVPRNVSAECSPFVHPPAREIDGCRGALGCVARRGRARSEPAWLRQRWSPCCESEQVCEIPLMSPVRKDRCDGVDGSNNPNKGSHTTSDKRSLFA